MSTLLSSTISKIMCCIQQPLCLLSTTWGHRHVSLSLFFVYYSINTPCIPRLTSSHALIFKKIPNNGNTHTHFLSLNYVSGIIQWRWFRHVVRYRGVALPLCDMIRELCCAQIELSELLPFNPPFHTKTTQTHCRVTVEWSDTLKMEIVRGTGVCGASLNVW